MDRKMAQRLVKQASEDPKFLHALVFETERVLGQLDYLDRSTKAKLVGSSPEEVVARIFGVRLGDDSAQDNAP